MSPEEIECPSCTSLETEIIAPPGGSLETARGPVVICHECGHMWRERLRSKHNIVKSRRDTKALGMTEG